MADEIRAGGAGRKSRVTRSTGGKGPRKAGKGGKTLRVAGLKAVDTIPRLLEKDFEDGESKAVDRLVEGKFSEGFTGEGFAEDLQRAHAFVIELAAQGAPGAGAHAGLHEECERILKDEVAKARRMADLRKGAPKA
jgi:hypothetical protein